MAAASKQKICLTKVLQAKKCLPEAKPKKKQIAKVENNFFFGLHEDAKRHRCLGRAKWRRLRNRSARRRVADDADDYRGDGDERRRHCDHDNEPSDESGGEFTRNRRQRARPKTHQTSSSDYKRQSQSFDDYAKRKKKLAPTLTL